MHLLELETAGKFEDDVKKDAASWTESLANAPMSAAHGTSQRS